MPVPAVNASTIRDTGQGQSTWAWAWEPPPTHFFTAITIQRIWRNTFLWICRRSGQLEFMFLGLRLMEGVSGTEFFSRFGQNMWNVYGTVIERLEKQGLIEVEMPVIRLTEQGIDVSNRVLSQFLLD